MSDWRSRCLSRDLSAQQPRRFFRGWVPSSWKYLQATQTVSPRVAMHVTRQHDMVGNGPDK